MTKRRACLRRTCQSRGAQVIGGGWTNRNGLRGGICRLHVDLRRRNLGTTASFRNWLDLVSSHAMIQVLGGLLSSNEQGGHTYFCFFFLPWSVAGAPVAPGLAHFAGNSARRREEAGRRRCGAHVDDVAERSGRWPVVSGFRLPRPYSPTGGRDRFSFVPACTNWTLVGRRPRSDGTNA